LLGWSEAKLAQMNKVSLDAIRRIEREQDLGAATGARAAVRRALEAAGIVLIGANNGVLIHEADVSGPTAGATVRMNRPELLMTLLAGFRRPRVLRRAILPSTATDRCMRRWLRSSSRSWRIFRSSHLNRRAKPREVTPD
jgi:hypothetical protein